MAVKAKVSIVRRSIGVRPLAQANNYIEMLSPIAAASIAADQNAFLLRNHTEALVRQTLRQIRSGRLRPINNCVWSDLFSHARRRHSESSSGWTTTITTTPPMTHTKLLDARLRQSASSQSKDWQIVRRKMRPPHSASPPLIQRT
jgi:hypothetical protein